MSALFSAPIWLGFVALAIPLLLVAASALHASQIYEIDDDPDADVATMQSTLENGTVVQTVEYSGFGSTAKVVTFFGPFGVAANARPWAASMIMLGLLLTVIGMVGMLHFPSQVPLVRYDDVPYSDSDDAVPGTADGGFSDPSERPEAVDPAPF